MADLIDRSLVRSRAEMLAAGYTDKSLARLVRVKRLVRIRHGAYVETTIWSDLGPLDRHRLLTRAVVRRSGAPVVVSHTSAAVEHGGTGWGQDLELVHLTRTDGVAGRREAGVVQHRGALDDAEVDTSGEFPVTTPGRSVAEVLNRDGSEPALALAHELIHQGTVTADEIKDAVERIGRWPGSLGTHRFLRILPARCESVAESRFLHLLQQAGIPLPETQVAIHDEGGRFVARVDGAWRELGVFFEVDGRGKYDIGLAAGRSARDLLWEEKTREDEVRRVTGWRCIRVTWADLESPARLLRRVRAALGLV